MWCCSFNLHADYFTWQYLILYLSFLIRWAGEVGKMGILNTVYPITYSVLAPLTRHKIFTWDFWVCPPLVNGKINPLCCLRKYPYSPHRGIFGLNLPPIWIFQFKFTISFKNVFETPFPLVISIGLPCGGNGYFLELHITKTSWR